MPACARLLGYIANMKPSMTTAMAAPIRIAMERRVSLKRTCSSAYVFRYIRRNMTTVEVAIIAAKRLYDMLIPRPFSLISLKPSRKARCCNDRPRRKVRAERLQLRSVNLRSEQMQAGGSDVKLSTSLHGGRHLDRKSPHLNTRQ